MLTGQKLSNRSMVRVERSSRYWSALEDVIVFLAQEYSNGDDGCAETEIDEGRQP